MTFKEELKKLYEEADVNLTEKEYRRKFLHNHMYHMAKFGYDSFTMSLSDLMKEILDEEGFKCWLTDEKDPWGNLVYVVSIID